MHTSNQFKTRHWIFLVKIDRSFVWHENQVPKSEIQGQAERWSIIGSLCYRKCLHSYSDGTVVWNWSTCKNFLSQQPEGISATLMPLEGSYTHAPDRINVCTWPLFGVPCTTYWDMCMWPLFGVPCTYWDMCIWPSFGASCIYWDTNFCYFLIDMPVPGSSVQRGNKCLGKKTSSGPGDFKVSGGIWYCRGWNNSWTFSEQWAPFVCAKRCMVSTMPGLVPRRWLANACAQDRATRGLTYS